MRISRWSGVLVALSVSVGVHGCSLCHRRPACPATAAVAAPCGPGVVPPPPAPAPFAGQGALPPAAAPVAPPGAVAPPPGSVGQPPPFPTGPGTQQSSNYGPPADSSWRPAEGAVQLAPPEPMGESQRGESQRGESPRLYPPTDAAPLPAGPTQPRVTEERRTPQPPAVSGSNPPSLPVGIPQFNNAKDRVASGLRPMLDDGLDWLQGHGYRTVLHLRRPGEDDTADRKQVEKRGLRYVTIEVSPQTLSRRVLDEFNRVIADSSGYPLFVYDRDGSLAGGMWYLHFRTAEQAADDAARVRAGSLGLREDRDGAHRDMWLAIQRLLSEQAP